MGVLGYKVGDPLKCTSGLIRDCKTSREEKEKTELTISKS